ncbi:MAG: mechanosensitive ion channel [Flavobacteriia bacterium]|nr:mechanosensitive ion channel [Flavobacteriia bacterium]
MFKIFEPYFYQIVFTIIIIVLWLAVGFVSNRTIRKIREKFNVSKDRVTMIFKITKLINSLIALIFIITIWGVDKKELLVFFTSIITVIGIAFFASWSFLSNITAGIILFFSDQCRIGEDIKIVDKDFYISGKIVNISFFFIHLINEQNEKIYVPNSIALQKSIVVLKK